jgi:hypothetical protein
MTHCKVLFLPPKTTSELQPCDAGIIQCFKCHFCQRQLRWMLRVIDEFEGSAIDLEKIRPNVKQAIIWTREAWNVGVLPKVISNCWRKTGILPPDEVEVVVESESSSDLISELATLLSEFATHGHILPDIMDAQELLALDPEPPQDEPEPEPVVEGVEEDEETEKQVTYKPVTLREARACMAKVAEFIQVNSSTRGLGRLVDVSIEIQSELDKTVVTAGHRQALMTAYMKPPPKITTISSP